jgi:hypothetical protein
MRIRYTAPVALVAWYLLFAPKTNGKMNVDAPVSQWTQSASYDTTDDCEAARKQIVAVATAVGSNAKPGSVWAMCVSAEDPRLKAK